MADFKELCVCNKLCFKLGTNTAENFNMLKLAFREEMMSRTQGLNLCSIQNWKNWSDGKYSGLPFDMYKVLHHQSHCTGTNCKAFPSGMAVGSHMTKKT